MVSCETNLFLSLWIVDPSRQLFLVQYLSLKKKRESGMAWFTFCTNTYPFYTCTVYSTYLGPSLGVLCVQYRFLFWMNYLKVFSAVFTLRSLSGVEKSSPYKNPSQCFSNSRVILDGGMQKYLLIVLSLANTISIKLLK